MNVTYRLTAYRHKFGLQTFVFTHYIFVFFFVLFSSAVTDQKLSVFVCVCLLTMFLEQFSGHPRLLPGFPPDRTIPPPEIFSPQLVPADRLSYSE